MGSLCGVFSLFAFPPFSIVFPQEPLHRAPVRHVCCEISSLRPGSSGSRNVRMLPRKGRLQLEKQRKDESVKGRMVYENERMLSHPLETTDTICKSMTWIIGNNAGKSLGTSCRQSPGTAQDQNSPLLFPFDTTCHSGKTEGKNASKWGSTSLA